MSVSGSSHRRNVTPSQVYECTVSDFRLDRRVSIPGRGKRISPLASVSKAALRLTQPPMQCMQVGSFPEGKARPERDADHSPPSSAEVKNE
jgi:hypothetical protein